MKPHEFDDSEAMAEIEGHDVTHLLGTSMVIDLQQDPQRRAFNAYKVAFNANALDPNLRNAAWLVHAWNAFAEIMGVARV